MTRTTASRVLLVIDGLNSGGAQQQLVRMFLGMRSRDVDVHLVYYSPHHHFVPQIPEPERARVRCLTDDPDESKAAVLGLLRAEIGRVRPDVVVSFLRGAAMLVGLARLSGLHFRWIACERSSHLGKDAFVRRALYARSLRLADLVTTNSYTVLPELEAAGVPARRLRMIPNGMFVTAHDPAPREAPPPTRFLAVGNLTPDKNYVLLVKALVGLKARDWRLDHLGRNTEAPEVLAQVQHLVKEHGLEDRVHLSRPHGPNVVKLDTLTEEGAQAGREERAVAAEMVTAMVDGKRGCDA